MINLEEEIAEFLVAGRVPIMSEEGLADSVLMASTKVLQLTKHERRLRPEKLLDQVQGEMRHLDLTDRISQIDEIRTASGGSADVFVGHIVTGTKVAIKRYRNRIRSGDVVEVRQMKYNIYFSPIATQGITRQLRIWSDFEHPNILPLLGYRMEDGYLSLIAEWMEKGTLHDYMHKIGRKEKIAIVS